VKYQIKRGKFDENQGLQPFVDMRQKFHCVRKQFSQKVCVVRQNALPLQRQSDEKADDKVKRLRITKFKKKG